jgi:DNA-3-methyladenine glycosylase
MAPRLGRTFFTQDPETLARTLLGQRLVRVLDDGTRLAGVIVETEAYLGIPDKAAHTYGGRRTPRNEAMYGVGGTAYVYFTYGRHFCMNVVAGKKDEPVAVLLRALEPTDGLAFMREGRETGRRSRSRKMKGHARLKDEDLCRGPGRLCEALVIDRSLNGIDLTRDSRLFLERSPAVPETSIGVSPRIGVDYAEEWTMRDLRFFIRGSRFMSGPPRLNRPEPES